MKLVTPCLCAVFTLAVTACGGGGGASSSSTTSSSLAASSIANSSSLGISTSSSSSNGVSSAPPTSSSAAVIAEPASVDADRDQFVTSGESILLTAVADGSDHAPFTYQWSQINETSVTFSDTSTATTQITVPDVNLPTQLVLQVVATDKNGNSYHDNLRINVNTANAVKRYEAEIGTLNGGVTVASQTAGYSGSGYVTGFDNSDARNVTWTVDTDAGFYNVQVGFQVSDRKGYNLTIDGRTTSGMMEPSADFDAVSLGRMWFAAGSHEVSIGGGWGYYNVDYLELIPMAAPGAPLAVTPTPVNSQASYEVRQLLNYLNDQYGHSTLSGQQDSADISIVLEKTGVRPAIYSYDLFDYTTLAVNAMGTPANKTENFINKIKSDGHIASLLLHWHSPIHAKSTVNPCPTPQGSCWWNSFYTEHTNIDLTAALADPDSAEYQALLTDIDLIAVQLKKVQAANIPVLWRPLHEADGGWFWWGASGADSFKSLWRLMYSRLTYHHGINNLIWVWTNETIDWYPGDDVVDIVSIDAYPSDKRDMLTSVWDKMYERFDGHKLIALTEIGGVPFIEEMHEQGIWWSYFASWINDLGPNKMTDQELEDIYTSDKVITLEEIALPPLGAPSGNKVMPLGDSITGSPGCWRQLLWESLQDAGITTIDFVGSLDNSTHCGEAYDGNNEGHGGFQATTIAEDASLVGWLNASNPDVVMMHLGTNDVWGGKSVATILQAYTTLVEQMRTNNPAMTILVAQIIPMDPIEFPCASCSATVVELNAAILPWAQNLSTRESPVIVVDQWTGFDLATDTSDGVHPVASGNAKIAARWFTPLQALFANDN